MPSEEDAIFQLAVVYENKWSKIAKLLPGRSENSIKNFFYSTVRKNLRRLNKKLVLKQKVSGSVRELMKNPTLHSLIFCNSRRSKLMVEQCKGAYELVDGINATQLPYENKIEMSPYQKFNQEICSKMTSQEIIGTQMAYENLWMTYWMFYNELYNDHIKRELE